MKFTFTVTKDAVNKAYEKEVKKAIANTKLKVFRKGKAPKDMVVKAVGEEALQQKALEVALPDAYAAAVKKEDIKPITFPKLTLQQGKMGEDFTFEAEVAETPEVELGDYKKNLKGTLSASEIWTPEKGEAKDKPEPTREEKGDVVLRKLLEDIKVDVPALLIEREVNRRLSQVVEQVGNLGMKMEDYLASIKKTKEELTKDYQEVAKQSIAIEFILMEVARDLKIEATNEDIDQMIASVGDKQLQERLQTPDERANLFVMITKQRAIDELLNLAE